MKYSKSGFWTGAAIVACLLPKLAFAEAVTAEHITEVLPKLNAMIRDGMSRTGVPGLAIVGWNVDVDPAGRVHLSHSGAFNLGVGTNVHLIAAQRLGIAVLTNGHPVGLAEAVSKSFLDLVFAGKVERDWIDAYGQRMADAMKPDYGDAIAAERPRLQASPALPVAGYLGTYDNDFYGELKIAEKNGSLVTISPHAVLSPSAHRPRHVHLPADRRERLWTERCHVHHRGRPDDSRRDREFEPPRPRHLSSRLTQAVTQGAREFLLCQQSNLRSPNAGDFGGPGRWVEKSMSRGGLARREAGLLRKTCLSTPASRLALAIFLTAGTPSAAFPASATNWFVDDEADLRSAITHAHIGDSITFTTDITLSANLPHVHSNVTIIGGNHTLSGNIVRCLRRQAQTGLKFSHARHKQLDLLGLRQDQMDQVRLIKANQALQESPHA